MSDSKDGLLNAYRASASAEMEGARALPFSVYTDGRIYELELRRLFEEGWVFVCAAAEIPEPGDYCAFFLAEEPVLVVRGEDGRLRAMSNACRHRGTVLGDIGFGRAARFVCPYHAWSYDTRGILDRVPHSRGTAVEREAHRLTSFALEEWWGLVFVNVSGDAEPLAPLLSGIEPYLELFGAGNFSHASGGAPEAWEANWKVAMENAMESYHLFRVHTRTLEPVTPTREAYYVEGSAAWSVTGGKMTGTPVGYGASGASGGAGGAGGAGGEAERTPERMTWDNYLLISLPPNFVGVLTYGSLDWVSTLPAGPERCHVRMAGISAYSGDPGVVPAGLAEAFLAEDKVICERVQRGMRARRSAGGKLVEMERVVVDFHNYLAWRLFGDPPRAPHRTPMVREFLGEGSE